MTMRSIVCLFDGSDQEFSAVATAVEMARNAAAHLRIVHARRAVAPTIYAGGGEILINPELIDSIERNRVQQCEEARSAAAEMCRKHQLQLDGNGCSLPRASFLSLREDGALTRELSLCDIVVTGAEMDDDPLSRPSLETALFNSGRPVLIVRPRPSHEPATLAGGGCAIAWNGTPEVIRALINARAIIRSAGHVHLLVANETGSGEQTRLQDAACDYLASHGIEARLEFVKRGHHSAAEAVLARTRELGCGCVVMGAYGHSVFREMMLGGFSQHMLRHCELPLVMCH